jgi:hypothetical protein
VQLLAAKPAGLQECSADFVQTPRCRWRSDSAFDRAIEPLVIGRAFMVAFIA